MGGALFGYDSYSSKNNSKIKGDIVKEDSGEDSDAKGEQEDKELDAEEKVVENPDASYESGSSSTDDFYQDSKVKKTRNNYIFNSNKDKVTYSDLHSLSRDELEIAKSEILARHGFVFNKNKPNLQEYFNSQEWYKPNSNFNADLLSDLEKSNYERIRADEFVKDAYNSNGEIFSDFVLPSSSTEVISDFEIASLNDWELAIAKNEIFARYGLRFSIECLANHFNSKGWYNPIPGLDPNMPLNNIEYKNIDKIVKEEESRWELRERDIAKN